MKEKIKNKSKILYIICGCIIILMGIIYLGIMNLNDTYSAEVCYCPEGYKDNGGNQCKSEKPIRTDTANCDNEAQCDNYRAQGYTCTTGGACTKVVYDYIAKTCTQCTYASKTECQTANNGYYCELNESTGCYERGSAICSAGKTFYANGVTQCQNETGYVCQCGYGNNGCCIVTDEKLGGGVDCTTGNTTGSCGDSTIEVCTINTTYSCSIGGKTYSYTCKHDSGSQTGASGSWSTCTIKQSSSSSSSSSSSKPSSSTPSSSKPSSSKPSSSKPSSSTPNYSSTNSSVPSSSSSQNVDKNPTTGSISIFIVWVIALGMLVYSIGYFKQSKFE